MRVRVLSFAFLVASVSFGQSITATKAYVDRRYAEAMNAIPSIVTNVARAVVTNEVAIGWSDWSFTALVFYDPSAVVTAVHEMKWIESDGESDCRFPCWRAKVTMKGTPDWGSPYETTEYYYSGSHWRESDPNALRVTLFTDSAEDSGVVAVRGQIKRNALGLARAEDLEKLPNHETVTNVARAVSNSFWDEKNEVLWRMEVRDGEPMFVPVTNENVKAIGGAL